MGSNQKKNTTLQHLKLAGYAVVTTSLFAAGFAAKNNLAANLNAAQSAAIAFAEKQAAPLQSAPLFRCPALGNNRPRTEDSISSGRPKRNEPSRNQLSQAARAVASCFSNPAGREIPNGGNYRMPPNPSRSPISRISSANYFGMELTL